MTIKEYCKEHGITMSQLAKELNIGVSLLSKIDSKRERPSEKMYNVLLSLGIDYGEYSPTDYKSHLKQENEALRQENARLKRENARLNQIIIKRLESAIALIVQSDCAIIHTRRNWSRKPKDKTEGV